jgi:hypothetical protein
VPLTCSCDTVRGLLHDSTQDLIAKEAAKVAHAKEAATVTTQQLQQISGGYSGSASASASESKSFKMFTDQQVWPFVLLCPRDIPRSCSQ